MRKGSIKKPTIELVLIPQITKRQKFVAGVIILSLGLFATVLLGRGAIYLIIVLAILTDVFLLWALFNDLKNNFSVQVFTLPFLYTLSVGLFYFLTPERFLTRIGITLIYALGLYSLYLSENIFTVSSIRTIALLSSARTVSFVITILSYFFLSNVLLSLHAPVWIVIPLLFLYTFPMIMHSVWIYALEQKILPELIWVGGLTFAILQVAVVLWFWPSTATVISLFLTGFFYSIVGLSQMWLDRRLFKGVIWEYLWVSVAVLVVLFIFTSWTGRIY